MVWELMFKEFLMIRNFYFVLFYKSSKSVHLDLGEMVKHMMVPSETL